MNRQWWAELLAKDKGVVVRQSLEEAGGKPGPNEQKPDIRPMIIG